MNSILKISLSILFIALSVSCNDKKESKTVTKFGEISVISPSDFKSQSLNETIIDVRTPKEFMQGHIEGAVNVNLFDKSFLNQMSKYDKKKPVFLYCKSGKRSGSASKKLGELGFEKIYDLQGGIKYWASSNEKIVK